MRHTQLGFKVLTFVFMAWGCSNEAGDPPMSPDGDMASDIGHLDAESGDSSFVDAVLTDASLSDAAFMDAEALDMGPDDGDGATAPISFARVFNEVLQPKGCTAGYCHAGHAGGLLMDSMETAYANLVTQDSSTDTPCDVSVRVVPGDPDASMLWVRVRPAADDCLTPEQKMPPLGGEGLTDAQLSLIHDWILSGANP